MLVECVALYEPALKASFYAVYGLSYASMDQVDAADLTACLPAGCALWRATGGPLALTVAEESLRWVDYRLSVLAWMKTEDAKHKRNQPKPPTPIPWAWEGAQDEARARRQMEARQRRVAS